MKHFRGVMRRKSADFIRPINDRTKSKEKALIKPNYKFEKRQKDIAKKKKQEEKRLRKLEKKKADEAEGQPETGATETPIEG
jgi:hypothetical protein